MTKAYVISLSGGYGLAGNICFLLGGLLVAGPTINDLFQTSRPTESIPIIEIIGLVVSIVGFCCCWLMQAAVNFGKKLGKRSD